MVRNTERPEIGPGSFRAQLPSKAAVVFIFVFGCTSSTAGRYPTPHILIIGIGIGWSLRS